MDDISQESEVAVDAEVEVGAEVEVRADSPLVHNTDGRSDRLAYVIYTTCRSCYTWCRQWDNAELDTLLFIIYIMTSEP